MNTLANNRIDDQTLNDVNAGTHLYSTPYKYPTWVYELAGFKCNKNIIFKDEFYWQGALLREDEANRLMDQF